MLGVFRRVAQCAEPPRTDGMCPRGTKISFTLLTRRVACARACALRFCLWTCYLRSLPVTRASLARCARALQCKTTFTGFVGLAVHQ